MNTDTQRTPLLSGPTSRRDLFRIGGMTLALGAIVAACGGQEEDVARTGGTLAEEPTEFDPIRALSPATLLRTSASIEQLMADSYQRVLDEGWLTEERLTSSFELFRDHHAEKVSLLADATREVDGEPYEEANAYLQATVVDPAVLAVTDALAEEDAELARTAVLDMAYTLENLALQTYVRATPALPTTELRHDVMSIAAGGARHIAVILTAEEQPLPFAVVPIGAAAPADATIDESGPVATPPTTAAPTEAE